MLHAPAGFEVIGIIMPLGGSEFREAGDFREFDVIGLHNLRNSVRFDVKNRNWHRGRRRDTIGERGRICFRSGNWSQCGDETGRHGKRKQSLKYCWDPIHILARVEDGEVDWFVPQVYRTRNCS